MADKGAVSRPSSVVTSPVSASYQTRNAPPPMPELCGSTNPRTVCTATMASAAVPPARSTSAPASTANGLAAEIIQSRASTGRPLALAACASTTRAFGRDGIGGLLRLQRQARDQTQDKRGKQFHGRTSGGFKQAVRKI